MRQRQRQKERQRDTHTETERDRETDRQTQRERDLSKIITCLPTMNEHVGLFEKALTGSFSCVNTHLSFGYRYFVSKR